MEDKIKDALDQIRPFLQKKSSRSSEETVETSNS